MIKAVFFDIDDTIYSHRTKSIPMSTLESLKKLRENNIKIFVSTGRLPWAVNMTDVIDGVFFDGYIYMNGQLCTLDNKIVFKNPINKDDINNLYRYVKENSIPCIFGEEKDMYINIKSPFIKNALDNVDIPMPPVQPLERILENDLFQIIPYANSSQLKDILELMPNCESSRWYEKSLDINPKGGTKALGIEKIMESLNLTIENAIAFGDSYNDIDMLEKVKIGVAMGNSNKDIKNAADIITDDIDNDGVYNALTKLKLI